MDSPLRCNKRSCRKKLDNIVWVTACSHIFCDEDGSRLFQKTLICPICQRRLDAQFDIIRHELQPTERFKSMVLSGLRPQLVIEICSKALGFWAHQVTQEKRYQEHLLRETKEKFSTQEDLYRKLIARAEKELHILREELKKKIQEIENIREEYRALSERHHTRNQQFDQLQNEFECSVQRDLVKAVPPMKPCNPSAGDFVFRPETSIDCTGTGRLPTARLSASLIDPGDDFVFVPKF